MASPWGARLEVRGIETMGGREVNDVFFTDCHVPADRLVGEQGEHAPLVSGQERLPRPVVHPAALVRRRLELESTPSGTRA